MNPREIMMEMRDGTRLQSFLYLPSGEGPFPSLMARCMYGTEKVADIAATYAENGYAVVLQNVRGRHASQGGPTGRGDFPEDGYDTLDWMTAQPWCNGRIGMFGDSYLAATQLLLAPEDNANTLLTALNPRFMAGDIFKRAYYADGAFSLGLTWSWLCYEVAARTSDAALLPLHDFPSLLRRLPIADFDLISTGYRVPTYHNYATRNRWDDEWAAYDVHHRAAAFTMPTLLTAGWYDYYPGEMLRLFTNLRSLAPSPQIAASHRLLIGPWTHGVNPQSTLGDIDFGPDALLENDATTRWLTALLHGEPPESVLPAPIRIFTMGVNRWQDLTEWPPAGATAQRWYLRQDCHLSQTPPAQESPDTYTYDPENPAPTHGGNHSIGPYNPGLYDMARPGPYDQRPVEARADVLTYTTEPLTADLELTGPVTLTLFAASSAPDTDFVARLCDVFPDGRSINLTEGILRARYRQSVWEPPTLLEPGRVYQLTIDLMATSNVFRAGHRLRLDITSSGFPLWDRNLNTGNDPATDTQSQPAVQAIHHHADRPSHLTVWAVPA